MPEKHLAVVFRKIDITADEKLYIPIGVTTGEIDEETSILTNCNGQNYKRITDYSDNDETVQGYYYEYLETADMPTDHKFYEEFEENAKNIKYYTSKVGDGIVIRALSKVEDLRMLQGIDPTQDSTIAQEDLIELDDEMITEAIKDLVCKVIDNKFSPDELIDLQTKMEDLRDEADAAVESIKLQQDSLETELAEHTKSATKQKVTVPTPTAIKEDPKDPKQIDIQKLFNQITKVLIAQDKAARRTIVEISRLNDMDSKEYGILLTGNTGVGKTLLMNLISTYINRPFLKIDSTQLTAPAYVGRSLEQYLWQLYESCGKNKELAETAIVYFDELDKKRSQKNNDVNGKSVQDTLLKFIEGTEYIAAKNPQQITHDTSVPISTKNMIIVASGAFIDVYQKAKKASDKIEMGFRVSQPEDTTKSKNTEPTVSDFITTGQMSNELMGRLPVVIHLDDLDVDNLARIISESDNSALKQQESVFSKRGVKLSTQSGYILSVAEQAFERKIGARGLNKLIADSTWQAYDQICCEPGVYDEVILTEETAKDNTKYCLVKKKNLPSTPTDLPY